MGFFEREFHTLPEELIPRKLVAENIHSVQFELVDKVRERVSMLPVDKGYTSAYTVRNAAFKEIVSVGNLLIVQNFGLNRVADSLIDSCESPPPPFLTRLVIPRLPRKTMRLSTKDGCDMLEIDLPVGYGISRADSIPEDLADAYAKRVKGRGIDWRHELKDKSQDCIILLAEHEGDPVGFARLPRGRSQQVEGVECIPLSPVFVSRRHRYQGLGRGLFYHSLLEAMDEGYEGVAGMPLRGFYRILSGEKEKGVQQGSTSPFKRFEVWSGSDGTQGFMIEFNRREKENKP